jgi:hypothetical protein
VAAAVQGINLSRQCFCVPRIHFLGVGLPNQSASSLVLKYLIGQHIINPTQYKKKEICEGLTLSFLHNTSGYDRSLVYTNHYSEGKLKKKKKL